MRQSSVVNRQWSGESDRPRRGGMTLDGPQSALARRWVSGDASGEEIERFFAEELASRGWLDGGGSSGIRSTGEFGAQAWRKDHVVFRPAFPDLEQRADPEPLSRYQTIYDARLIGKEVDGHCS